MQKRYNKRGVKFMIPIYRAKKIDSDEFAVGFLKNCTDTGLDIFWIQDKDFIDYRIDVDTLSINFPDILDSKGNEIFASLQEDGKGGDIMQDDEYFGIAKYKYCQFVVEYEDCIENVDNRNFEVIGIQQL